jgi:hypothetical protein
LSGWALDAGKTVEIEGLGTFRVAARDRGCQFEPQTTPEIFLAYVAEDLAPARRLYEALCAEGFSPWLDQDQLLPGQNWHRAIERAIENSDAFVACFSTRSLVKRGQFQSELRCALDCARRRPLDQAFLIPVRLEECAVPRRIASQVHYVDLFPDWHKGVRRIARSIRKAARSRPVAGLAPD